MRIDKIFYLVVGCAMLCGAVGAVELTGTISVNVTADTANAAKNKAFNSARRDVI